MMETCSHKQVFVTGSLVELSMLKECIHGQAETFNKTFCMEHPLHSKPSARLVLSNPREQWFLCTGSIISELDVLLPNQPWLARSLALDRLTLQAVGVRWSGYL